MRKYRSDVEEEAVFLFFEGNSAEGEHQHGVAGADDEHFFRGHLTVERKGTENADIDIHGVQIPKEAELLGDDVDGVEDGGDIQPDTAQNVIEIAQVTQESAVSAKQHTKS